MNEISVVISSPEAIPSAAPLTSTPTWFLTTWLAKLPMKRPMFLTF